MAKANPEDIYSLIGFTLSYIQSVESNLSFVTTFVLQDAEPLTLEKLNSIIEKERKKALGYFMTKVKERARLAPALENLLAEFLQNRNDFIHNQDRISGWSFDTEEGLSVAKQFTLNLLFQGHKINEIFATLVNRWQEQTGIYPPNSHGAEEYLQELDKKYGEFINIFFTQKT